MADTSYIDSDRLLILIPSFRPSDSLWLCTPVDVGGAWVLADAHKLQLVLVTQLSSVKA